MMQNGVQEITEQVAVWDSQMDSLDRQQEQLLNDQWRLLRTQLGSLMGALSEVRAELNDLKANVITKEMESVIENMVIAHDGHDKNHSSITDRLTYLETVMGESADKHGVHEQHRTTMEQRMEFVEALIGDNADKHAGSLAELQKCLDGCAQADHHATMAERVGYLETFLGESADKHEKDLLDHKAGWEDHKTTLETRLEYLEGLMGDSADKHAAEIEAAHKKCADLHEVIQGCAKAEHHSSMEARMEYVEGLLGESADKHDSHKTTVETRLEFLEGLLGDSAEKHASEIDAAKNRMADLHAAIASCAKTDHHASLETRMEYLENVLGESADKHDGLNQKHAAHKTAMEQRLEYIEAMLGDAADKHSKELNAAKSKLGGVDQAIGAAAKSEQRVNYLERFMSETSDKHEKDLAEYKNAHALHKTTMEQRLVYMENMLAGSNNAVSQEMTSGLEAAQAKARDALGKVDGQRASLESIKESTDKRLQYIEQAMFDGAYGNNFVKHMDQRMQAIQEEEKRARDMLKNTISQSIKEQLDLQHSAIISQSSQVKELWDREAMSRKAHMESYKQHIAQERQSRMMDQAAHEERMMTVEATLGLEPLKTYTRTVNSGGLVTQVSNPHNTMMGPGGPMTVIDSHGHMMVPGTMAGNMSPRIPPPAFISQQMPMGTVRQQMPPSVTMMGASATTL